MPNENYIFHSATQDFPSTKRRSSILIASGTTLCVFPPVILLILISPTRLDILTWPINFITGIGVVVLLAFIAVTATLFIAGDRWLKVHENYEYKDCSLLNSVKGKAIRENKACESQHMIFKATDITFYILPAIPLMNGTLFIDALTNSKLDDLMTGFFSAAPLLVGIDVFLLVKTNIIHDSFNIILQPDDYISEEKAGKKLIEKYVTIYWMIISFIYLAYSFSSNS